MSVLHVLEAFTRSFDRVRSICHARRLHEQEATPCCGALRENFRSYGKALQKGLQSYTLISSRITRGPIPQASQDMVKEATGNACGSDAG
eukprot:2262141-Pleurochrysis_carterae.AAC.1